MLNNENIPSFEVDGETQQPEVSAGVQVGIENHKDLKGRDLPNQHPISAITGLQEALDSKAEDGDFVTKDELDKKQDAIEDLAEIREGAEKGATAVQPSVLEEYATKQELADKQDKGDYALKSEIPKKVSALENDAGYLTEHQDISGLATKQELAGKQDFISDLPAIRSGSALGATAVQPSALKEYATKQELNDKQDTIEDLAEIRSGSEKGATAVQKTGTNQMDSDADIVFQKTNSKGATTTVNIDADGLLFGLSASGMKIAYLKLFGTQSGVGIATWDDFSSKGFMFSTFGIENITVDADGKITRGTQVRIPDKSGLLALTSDLKPYRKAAAQDEIDEAIRESIPKIDDLDTIRSGAAAGSTAVQGVQINGTSVVVDNVANIPVASVDNLGVVKVNPTRGLGSVSSGDLVIISATEVEITDKTNNSKPISPKRLDIAIREGLGNNSLTWTDAYKSNARNTIGAGQQRTTVVDSTTPTITLDNALANTDYQYGTITSLTIQAVENSYLETNFYFTAGSEITVDLPDTLKIIGTPSFEANKQYAMSICNNTLIVGTIS